MSKPVLSEAETTALIERLTREGPVTASLAVGAAPCPFTRDELKGLVRRARETGTPVEIAFYVEVKP